MSVHGAHEVASTSGQKDSAFGLTEIWSRGERLTRLGRWAMVKQLVTLAWRSVVSAPLTSLLTLATMSVALFLLAAFCLLLQTLNRVAVETRTDVALTIYLKDAAPSEARAALEGELKSQPEVGSLTFKSSDAALAEFSASLGDDAALLEGLADKNPLPASFDVKFKPEFGSIEVYRSFAARYEGNPLVDHIHYSGGVVGRLGAIMQTLRVGGGGAILFMLIATGFLMANTIKLALYAHRSEIEIMRLVGATQG
ncbi:MAG: Cell division protein FtsX, partial [Pseudomonadota bacterium]